MPTTIRLNADDLKDIQVIKDKYGATSTAGAIRLALRQVAARAENRPAGWRLVGRRERGEPRTKKGG